MSIDQDNADFEPPHATSATGQVQSELQLFGYHPSPGEPDPRALPDPDDAAAAIADIFGALTSLFSETRLEPDLDDLLWSTTNIFHRAIARVERTLDFNEQSQRRSQEQQDGSEVRSVELERLIAEGLSLIERRNSLEAMRDLAAEQFERHAGTSWRPRAGSKVSHQRLTSAVIDSRDFINARKRADRELLIPKGTLIAFSAGAAYNDHRIIWDLLDRILAKYPDMVLAHGASELGGERIASCWASDRKVAQIAFAPDWRLKKAAPFKRNDRMLEALPKGVIIFPGTGIQDNLHDKAKAMGLHCWDFRGKGGA